MRLGQIAILCLLGAGSVQAGPQTHGIDPDTGAETWTTQVHGVTLRLTQILPDQARAFYINRGFTAAEVEPYARDCVYMTVLRNDAAPGEVGFRLDDWRFRHQAGETPPRKTDDWMATGASAACRSRPGSPSAGPSSRPSRPMPSVNGTRVCSAPVCRPAAASI